MWHPTSRTDSIIGESPEQVDPSQHIQTLCAALPGAELTHPFGNETSVYKVGGKMFAAIGTGEGGIDRITVKCDPERAEVLVGEHEHIVPGYHMNKRHWITIDLGGSVPLELVEDLVDDSHFLVHGKARR
ncbi:MmcQ/YjbR family DNA-binding protein [Rhodococcus sp. P1Y]|nr:MmcQ/YjbR family DNA-binding protein [Rhodococcus sp. P1Y]